VSTRSGGSGGGILPLKQEKQEGFLLKPVGENELKSFLAKACWYAGVSFCNVHVYI